MMYNSHNKIILYEVLSMDYVTAKEKAMLKALRAKLALRYIKRIPPSVSFSGGIDFLKEMVLIISM